MPPAGNSGIAPLVLAAGLGRRFGGPKLLTELHGKPLLWHALRPIVELLTGGLLTRGVVVVRGGDRGAIDLVQAAGLDMIPNLEPELGASHSLRLGLDALARRPPTSALTAALIMMGDQPGVSGEVILRILDAAAAHPGTIVRPVYASEPDTPGHPALIPRGLWPLARQLSGDTGFSQILRLRPDLVRTVDVPGANPDIDSPSDLNRF